MRAVFTGSVGSRLREVMMRPVLWRRSWRWRSRGLKAILPSTTSCGANGKAQQPAYGSKYEGALPGFLLR